MKFVIDCLRGIEKLKSGHWFHQLRRIALDVDPEAKETVDHILNGAFVSFYVGRKWEAIEEMEKLPIAWFIGDKFWKWKMYIDHWITEKTQFLDRSLHDKFELFVYTRITSILNMYLSPKDQRLRFLKHALEKIEEIFKQVDVQIHKRETRPSQAGENQEKVTAKEPPSRTAGRKPESHIDTRPVPGFRTSKV